MSQPAHTGQQARESRERDERAAAMLHELARLRAARPPRPRADGVPPPGSRSGEGSASILRYLTAPRW